MLIKLWWAEKVVRSCIDIFPEADIYTLIYDEHQVAKDFPREKIHPSCFKLSSQRIYNITKKQRLCLPFMAKSVTSLDFSSYDRVIVSSSWFAHWLRVGKNTKTIIYYHAPARYMWDWAHEYRKEISMSAWLKWFLYWMLMKRLREQDYYCAQNNDILLSNSSTTQKRIQKYYRRNSKIIYPPIETLRFAKKLKGHTESQTRTFKEYYIILSALTEFKKIDIAIWAIKKLPDIHLIIIWSGEHEWELKKLAWNSKNIVFTGAQYWDDLVQLVQRSLGLIFPGEEDFWIVPIEVMAAWKPVFALKKWWLTETIIEWKTWEFFSRVDWKDFIENFNVFHGNNLQWKYTSRDCKNQAKKYDTGVFKEKIKSIVLS